MATEQNLGTIHIFPSEDAYNQNQNSIGNDDLSLVKMPEDYDYIVESGETLTDWYKKYKSGWLEQGGIVADVNTGAWASKTITLPKPFANNKYYLIANGNWSNPESSSCYITAKTTTNFTLTYAVNNQANSGYWEAKGYAAD